MHVRGIWDQLKYNLPAGQLVTTATGVKIIISVAFCKEAGVLRGLRQCHQSSIYSLWFTGSLTSEVAWSPSYWGLRSDKSPTPRPGTLSPGSKRERKNKSHHVLIGGNICSCSSKNTTPALIGPSKAIRSNVRIPGVCSHCTAEFWELAVGSWRGADWFHCHKNAED